MLCCPGCCFIPSWGYPQIGKVRLQEDCEKGTAQLNLIIEFKKAGGDRARVGGDHQTKLNIFVFLFVFY